MARQNILFCGGNRIDSLEDLHEYFAFEDLKSWVKFGTGCLNGFV